MKRKIQFVNNGEAWDANRRYKINAIVTYNGTDWQNTTGKNSEPGVGADWKTCINTFQEVMEAGNSYNQTIGNFSYTLQFDESSSTFVCFVLNNTTNEGSLISLSSLISYVQTTNNTFTSGNLNDLSEGATLVTSKVVEGTNKIVVPYRTSGANTDIAIFVPPNNKPTGTYTFAIIDDIPTVETQRSTATSGTVNAPNTNKEVVFIHEAGVTATLTYAFPPSPIDKQRVTLMSVGGIVALTLTAATGTIMNTTTAFAAGGSATYMYLASQTKWYKIG
jgi:hypothetical protein